MYLRSFSITNIRAISKAKMRFAAGKEAGWHVILGANGSGKSSLVRAFALLMMGEREAWAARQDFAAWMKTAAKTSVIEADVVCEKGFDISRYLRTEHGETKSVDSCSPRYTLRVEMHQAQETSAFDLQFQSTPDTPFFWSEHSGRFAASFGPFRRFSGGDQRYERMFLTNKRLAPHLTAMGEDVALTDAMSWLPTLFAQGLHDEKNHTDSGDMAICNQVVAFLNQSAFLPHGAQIKRVTNKAVLVEDGNGNEIPIDQLSDGYRSALSLVLELLRQMFVLYDSTQMLHALEKKPGTVQAPGVVFIDEIDAHLHPDWQRDIGRWLTRCFPRVQFIVTTHSPIICRAVARDDGSIGGTVWRLPAPGEKETFHKIEGDTFNQLVFGNVLDAYATDLFGNHVLRSASGDKLLERLAELNVQALDSGLNEKEEAEQRALRKIFPSAAGTME